MGCVSYSYFVLFVLFVSKCWAGKVCIPEELAEENLRKLAKANNALSLDILDRIFAETNVFFSPLSLSTAFSMLAFGTGGETAKELRRTFYYEYVKLPEELVPPAFCHLLTESLPSSDPNAYVLNLANAVLLDKRLNVIPSYKSAVHNIYQASVQDVDFLTEGPQTVDEINGWVKDKTNGKITKLLNDLDPSTILVLLNAVYFKGTWKTQFDKSKTLPATFYNYGQKNGAKEVPMMRLTERFPYTAVYDLQAIELPYKGENISMIILLPNTRDGLNSVVRSLTLEKLSTITQQLYKTKVHLTLPKFKVEYEREMSTDFRSLGVDSIFRPGADFSGITTDKNVFVTQVLHKAVVEVNEEGSEAAAVTGIISNRMRPILDFTPEFTVDHPFLFAIVDRRSDMILFLGAVTDL